EQMTVGVGQRDPLRARRRHRSVDTRRPGKWNDLAGQIVDPGDRDVERRHAAQDRGVVPDTELDLNGGDRGDSTRFIDLANGDVAQADAVDEAIALQG